jgi:hypothetical protein
MTKLLWIPVGLVAFALILVGGFCNVVRTIFAYGDDWCDRREKALADFMLKFDDGP